MIHDLLRYNKLGLIPGPNETEEDFYKRAKHCLELHHLVSILDDQETYHIEKSKSEDIIKESSILTEMLYDIVPTWTPIFFSNKKLAPWHGGCAWIFQIDDTSPMSAFFQLRKAFASTTKYLGLYERNELIAHEAAHVGRMMFQEPKFEEVLAYQSSPSKLRRFLGPIVETTKESVFFVIMLMIIFSLDFFFVFYGYEELYLSVMWLKAIPILMIVYGLFRLAKRHQQFAKCKKTLQSIFNDKKKVNAVIYRLVDSEIIDFGAMSANDVLLYAKNQKSLRWEIINSAYFSSCLVVYKYACADEHCQHLTSYDT